MKPKKLLLVLAAVMALLWALPGTAFADIGPKPSVQIEFTNAPEGPYYGTLLSERKSTGPASAWDGSSEYYHYAHGEEGYPIWQKFISYQDADGYYFLQEWWDCSADDSLRWTYYPPSPFKILLYFPETDSFAVSPIYERYAFDSYYTVDLSDWQSGQLAAVESYDHSWELISLVARIIITLILELALALLFGYREKRQLMLLGVVNIITQVALNVALNVINYVSGSMGFVVFYILLELLVFALEAVLFVWLLPRMSRNPQKRGKAVGYAFVANALSFALGLWLAQAIPGIF